MALETEGKVLDKQAAELGVKGLFDRPQFGFYLLANIGEKPAASLMVTYEWSDWRNGLFWWIQSVYVKTEFRRQGIYAAMYSELKKWRLSLTHQSVDLGYMQRRKISKRMPHI